MRLLPPQLLTGLDLKLLSIQRTKAGRWWNFKTVISPFSRLWLVLGGKAEVSHHGRRYALKPGCLHLVPAFAAHDCSCADHLDHFYLHFIARLNTGVDLFSLLDCDFQQPARQDTQLHFERLEALYPNRRLPNFDPASEEYRAFSKRAEHGSADLSIAALLETSGLLSLMLSPFLDNARVHDGIHARVTRQFQAVQEYIHQRIQQPIALRDLAQVAGLHPTYFSDRFEALVGERPLAYLLRYRLERAQFHLLTSRLSIKQVAFEVGISDPAYFTRAFTRFWGIPPTKYRAQNTR